MEGLRRALVGWVALVLVAVALADAPAAAAHAGDPNIDTLIVGLRPGLPSVQVEVIQGIVPALSVLNSSTVELQVLDAHGTPFLRIGPRGAEGNAAAPAFYRSAAPGDVAPVPAGVGRAGARARWVLLSHRPAWAWYDDRVPNVTVAPPRARARSAPTQLASFSIALRYGLQAATAQGVVTYVPPRLRPVAQLTSSMHPAAGVTVALLPGSYPDLYVQNGGSQTVTILGDQGEPFAQIGPRGVRVNVRSPIYSADATARGQAPAASANPAARPLWRQVSSAPAYDWLDPRPRFQSRWSVPMLRGGKRISISGTLGVPAPALASGQTRRQPPRRSGGDGGLAPPVIAVLALAAVAVLAGVAMRISRRRRIAGGV